MQSRASLEVAQLPEAITSVYLQLWSSKERNLDCTVKRTRVHACCSPSGYYVATSRCLMSSNMCLRAFEVKQTVFVCSDPLLFVSWKQREEREDV